MKMSTPDMLHRSLVRISLPTWILPFLPPSSMVTEVNMCIIQYIRSLKTLVTSNELDISKCFMVICYLYDDFDGNKFLKIIIYKNVIL